jgi:hypothetical protein
MSTDSFTTTTNTSWGGRIGNALGGILFGIILFLGAFVLLTWNEGRAIKREKTLKAGAEQVVSVSPDEVVAANDGKLIHFSGEALADEAVSDPIFAITVEALKLRRTVEMYQWQETSESETKEKLGGGEETVTNYSYKKVWSDVPINSDNFQVTEGHTNPANWPLESETFVAEGIHVGDFDLPPSLVGRIDNFTALTVTAEEAEAAAQTHNIDLLLTPAGGLYWGNDPNSPVVGDIRISFEQALPGPVSVIAGQVGQTLEPFNIGSMGSIELLQTGTFSADVMFQQEQESNTMLTWILRLAGFVMMVFGLQLIMSVVSVVASVIPFLGQVVGAGLGMLTFAVALPLTLVTIALAWLAYRPLIGIPLLVVAGASIFFAGTKLARSRKAK